MFVRNVLWTFSQNCKVAVATNLHKLATHVGSAPTYDQWLTIYESSPRSY